jgi:D-psicose/D-tagatose/L-ribulose 3-epimerase
MRYGMSLLLWTDTLEDAVVPVLEQLKELGYDAVELPIFELDVPKYAAWGKRLDAIGLARTAATVRGPDQNPISPDAAVRRCGLEANKRAADCAAAAGCDLLVGPYYTALGCFSGAGPTTDEWQWAIEGMRPLAEHADALGLTLGLEYLNRFEGYLLNSAADAARFCREVNHPRCQALYDTFHAHIEEKSTAAAIRALQGCLAEVHISENDRSTPGSGSVHWDETFDTLHAIGYDGLLMIEAFGQALERLVPATKIWRAMFQNERQLSADGLRFMQQQVAERRR